MDDIELRHGKATRFTIGLDLGQARDYSAIVASCKHVNPFGEVYHGVVFTHRFGLKTPYAAVAYAVADFMSQLPAMPDSPVLLADATGVGRPVVDLIRDQGLEPWAVSLTAGIDWHFGSDPYSLSLPKALMVSTLNVAFQSRNVGLASGLTCLKQLVRELGTFTVKSTAAGNDSFNSRTEADHDDLVVALGLAVFGGGLSFGRSKFVML